MSDERQLEFSFMEEVRTEEKRTLPYFENPRDDNQRLLNCQHDWLVNGDKDAWAELWRLSEKVARRMVQSLGRKHGWRFTGEDLDDRVMVAIEYVLRRYRDGWYVKKAYLKALKEGVIHALWYRTKRDESEQVMPDEVLALYRVYDRDPFGDDRPLVMIEGLTREQAVAKIRAEFLPEIAERLLEKVRIIGGVSNEETRDNQGGADAGA